MRQEPFLISYLNSPLFYICLYSPDYNKKSTMEINKSFILDEDFNLLP